MSKHTVANLFILPPSLEKSAELYQALLRGIGSYQQLGERLIQLAEQAHAFRQFDKVKDMGLILSNIPIRNYQAIGHYFLGIAANSKGNGNQDKARRILESVADTAPEPYRAKTILSLAAVASNMKDYPSQFRYLIESAKASGDISTTVKAHLGVAIYKSRERFHQQSLRDLENLYTLARHAHPLVFFDYLNSLAVELGEVGRKDEARSVMRHVLASPFAFAYPEWQQTATDLQAHTRSMIQVASLSNVFSLPPAPERVVESSPTQPAKILSLAEWKEKMVKEKNDEPDENVDLMDRKDLLVKLLELTAKEDIDEEKLRRIVKYAEATMTRKKPPDEPAS